MILRLEGVFRGHSVPPLHVQVHGWSPADSRDKHGLSHATARFLLQATLQSFAVGIFFLMLDFETRKLECEEECELN